MTSSRLTILNCLPEDAWDELRKKPRFLQPHEYSKEPCRHCTGLCCQADIRTTTVEAVRIALTLGVPLLEFLDVVPASEYADSAREWPIIVVESGEFRLRLKKTGGWCIWLHRVGERGRCAIHALRPGPCRLYPFELSVGERHVSVGSQKLCPVGWVKTAALEEQMARDLAAFDADMAAERELMEVWKVEGKGGGVEEFLHFAVAREGRRQGFEVDEFVAPRRKTLGRRLW